MAALWTSVGCGYVVFLSVLNVAITCVFSGFGRPALHRRAVAASAVAMLIAIYPACKLFGVVGGQVAALLSIILSYVLQVMRMRGLTGLDLLRYGRAFALPVLGSAVMVGVVLSGRRLGITNRPTVDIALCVGTCVATYGICAVAHLRAARMQDSLYSARTPESESAAVL